MKHLSISYPDEYHPILSRPNLNSNDEFWIERMEIYVILPVYRMEISSRQWNRLCGRFCAETSVLFRRSESQLMHFSQSSLY